MTHKALILFIVSVNLYGQTWTAPVLLGPTSDGKAALAMNSSGTAFTAFGNTPSGGAGTIYSSLSPAGAPWPAASMLASSSYDANHPATALDATGASVTIFSALQFDGLPNAYVYCMASPAGTPTFCATLSSPIAVAQPLVRSYGTSTTVLNNAVALIPTGCQLEALVSYSGSAFYYESSLLNAGDCLSAFDVSLDAAGNGAAVYRTKTGAIGAMARTVTKPGSAFWDTPVQIAAASTLNAHIAVSTAPNGDETIAYTVGKSGSRTVQVWAATRPAGGVFQTPIQITATACDLSVSVANAGNNDTVVAYAAKDAAHCAPTAAVRPAGGSFGVPVKLAAKSYASLLTATGTQRGSFVVAWADGGKSAVCAATGTRASFTGAVRIGGAGIPALAAGGAYVSALVCATTCSASSLLLP